MNQVQNIFGILLSIFILSYILQNWLDIKVVQNAKHYYKEALYATGLKKRPIIEPVLPSIFKMVAQIPKMFMMVFKIMASVGGIASFIANLAQGTINIIAGMVLSFFLALFSIGKAMWEFGILFIYLIEFFVTHMWCFMKILFSSFDCILWYLIEVLGKVLYLLGPTLFISVLLLIGIDLRPMEKSFWVMMESLDKIAWASMGFHIIHFPKWVRDRCYNCKRLKVSKIGNQFFKFSAYLTENIPRDAAPGISTVQLGFGQFMDALKFIMGMFG
jgi:hypothetical protein